jgi:hypothetical protein
MLHAHYSLFVYPYVRFFRHSKGAHALI